MKKWLWKSVCVLLAVALSAGAYEKQATTGFNDAAWTMSANNTVSFNMDGFDSPLLGKVAGEGYLSRIAVTVMFNSLSVAFAIDPTLVLTKDFSVGLKTKNANNSVGLTKEPEALAATDRSQSDGAFYTVKRYPAFTGTQVNSSLRMSENGNFAPDHDLAVFLNNAARTREEPTADLSLFSTSATDHIGMESIPCTSDGFPASVPEPAMGALALIGVGLLFVRCRRRVG